MNLVIVIGIVSIILCIIAVDAWHNEEIDTVAMLIIGLAVIFLLAGAVVLYYEDYNPDCTCSCECYERSETD